MSSTLVAARYPHVASVGIFWQVAGTLVTDTTPLASADSYGECLTHAGGHYEKWTNWQALPSERATAGLPDIIATSEYDEWPHGRIVYQTSRGHFIIYCDVRLMRPRTIEKVKTSFGLLQENVLLMSDSHYR